LPATGHGTPLQLVGHTQSIGASAFDPTSTRLVTASMDHTARVWDVATGALLATHQHLGAVASVAMFHAGTRFVTGAADGDARIFSLVDLTAPPIVLVHPVVRMDRKEPIEVVDVSRDDTLVLTASYFRGNVSVWPARGSRKPASVLANDRYITSARFLSDGHSVLVTFDDQRIDCCEAAEVFALDGRRLQALAGDDTFSATLVEPGVILLTGERSVKVWNRGAAVPTAQFELPWPGPMVAFASTTSLLVSGGNSHLVARFTAEPERTYSLANHAGTIVSLVISHDGAWIVSGAIDHTAMMWATADLGREEAVLTTATDEELRVRLRRDIEPCLPPDDRESYLREPRATALARWRGCELACWGRTFAAGLEVDTTVPCVR
jgi:WD40 repeat protein